MKIIGGLAMVVAASVALLQPAEGSPSGGGHSYAAGHSFSGGGARSGHYSGGARYYGGGARYYGGGARYYGGGYYGAGARYYGGGARYYGASSRTAAFRNTAYYSRMGAQTNVNRTTALNPRTNGYSGSRTAGTTTARRAALHSQGFDSQGRVLSQSSRSWNRNQDHFWHGHRCHFNNGAWVIVDAWPWWYGDYYPWGYGYYGPYPYSYDQGYYDEGYGDNGYDQSQQEGNVVGDVQSALSQKGYYHGAIDGRMGPETRSAIRQYQRNHGMEVTGNIDQAVVDALRRR